MAHLGDKRRNIYPGFLHVAVFHAGTKKCNWRRSGVDEIAKNQSLEGEGQMKNTPPLSHSKQKKKPLENRRALISMDQRPAKSWFEIKATGICHTDGLHP